MRDFKIYVSIASLLLIVYLVAQFNKPAPLNWKSTLYYNDKIPFGTYILYQQLNHLFPGTKVVNTNQTLVQLLHNNHPPASNYFIISNSVDLNKYDYKEMVDYIKDGNNVFISSFTWGGKFADTLQIGVETEYTKKRVALNFTNSKLKGSSNYNFDHEIGNQYFSDFDTTHAVVLSKNEFGKSTLLCFKYGKGALYLCANPLLFTNYNLLSARGADYTSKVLSYLPVKQNIYWDELQNGDIPEDGSPLRVFFSYPSLQWAYYISLFSLFTFILYEVKRRQRIIPVIEPLKNSTVDFVNVVGQVYYEQRNNQNISAKKILYFLEYIRSNYYLKTNKLDNEFLEKLVQKTGIEENFARDLVNHLNYLSVQPRINDGELITLNQLIEEFYTQSK